MYDCEISKNERDDWGRLVKRKSRVTVQVQNSKAKEKHIMRCVLCMLLMLAGCQYGNYAASHMQQYPHWTGKRACTENDFTLSKSGQIKCGTWKVY